MNEIQNKNKYLLAIETSNVVCSICICENEKILDEENIKSGFTHSVILFKNIDKMLKRNNLSMKDISEIGVSNGPGSYTGLRIGVACALGLAKPNNTKIRYIDSLKVLTRNVESCYKELFFIDYIFLMNDAKANRIYLSIWDRKVENNIIETIVNIDDFVDLYNKYFTKTNLYILFIGDALFSYKEKLKNMKGEYYTLDDDLNYPYARSICLDIIKNKEEKDSNKFINYMQKSQAERELLKNGNKKN